MWAIMGDANVRRRQRRNLVYTFGGTAAVLAAAVVLAASIGGTGSGRPAAPGEVQVSGPARTGLLAEGERVPGFSAPALGGGRIDWGDYAGQPVVLALWASWCPHCQTELPVLAATVAAFPNVRLVTITTSIGQRPGPSPAEYMKERHLDFPVAVDDAKGTLARAFGLQYFPTLYFVRSDGTVMRALEGEVPASDLRTLLGALS